MGKRGVEILAPAGSPDSFRAAASSGADAVYLGLKSFNARGNAINFTMDDLRKHVPLAHEQGMRVYLTLNTLVKMDEREPLLRELARASEVGIDGVILQDIGLGRMIARHFPRLRRHASTQMAIHNLDGVRFCVDEGFERVVLARELTLAEIQEIRAAFPSDVIELEVFCHGAMCYTYSGMCFFSGSVGGRSGNRGECAYTCRKGYRIHNETPFPMAAEPGSFNNYLFSMKDMNTLDVLPQLLDSGIDSLKIEGRRKGPAYVSASVQAYRDRLDSRDSEGHEQDLELAFGREYTKAFYQRGQFGDAPIDVTATGTKGRHIGTLDADGSFVLLESGIQRYDGIRLVRPNRDEETISFRDYRIDRGDKLRPQIGTRIQLSESYPEGTKIMWVRSQAVEQRYRPGKEPARGREVGAPKVEMTVIHESGELQITAACRLGVSTERIAVEPSTSGRPLKLKDLLFRFGDTPFEPGAWVGPEQVDGFVPLSQLKKLRRRLLGKLAEQSAKQHSQDLESLITEALNCKPVSPDPNATDQWIMRVDKLPLLEAANPLAEEHGYHLDLVMRPTFSTPDWRRCLDLLADWPTPVRLVLPMVLRKWDLRVIRHRLKDLPSMPVVLSNPGNFPLVKEFGLQECHLDFSVYHLNNWAYDAMGDLGIKGRYTLSLEDDRPNMEALLAATDPNRFEVIAYTDTPLFIAEACSLAALYGGCPGTKVCGHETLHIENEHGDRFQVRHDRCRSTVIGDHALSWSGDLDWFRQRGVRHFRADFTVRDYNPQRMGEIMTAISQDRKLHDTHTENLDRILL